MKFKNIERLLPFGYLYLVVLGLVKDGVLYFQLGINIGLYSSLTDILISPIVSLTSHPIFLGGILFYTLFLYLYFYWAFKRIDKKWVQKVFNLSSPENFNAD